MFILRDDYNSAFDFNLKRVTVDGVRYYMDEDLEEAYPSVTSVLSFINAPKFAGWRKRVGEEAANRKTKRATTRGTRLHTLFEHYLNNDPINDREEYQVPLINLMFNAAKPVLDKRINNIFEQETFMRSTKLELAGTVDLIAEFDGELSIIDFKTSEREKPEEWLEGYFVQLSAYWAMFAEATGVVPKQLVVFLVAENGDIQIVKKDNPLHYLRILRDYASQFAEHNNA